MSGHDITTGFMIATGVMVGVCALASHLRREALEVFAAAAVVFVFTMVSRIWSANTSMPLSAVPWPLQDLICGLLAVGLFVKHREAWKFALAVAFSLQCAAHVLFWCGVVAMGTATRADGIAYIWVINSVFAAELLILTLAGGRHVVSHALDRLRVSGGSGSFAHHGVARGR